MKVPILFLTTDQFNGSRTSAYACWTVSGVVVHRLHSPLGGSVTVSILHLGESCSPFFDGGRTSHTVSTLLLVEFIESNPGKLRWDNRQQNRGCRIEG